MPVVQLLAAKAVGPVVVGVLTWACAIWADGCGNQAFPQAAMLVDGPARRVTCHRNSPAQKCFRFLAEDAEGDLVGSRCGHGTPAAKKSAWADSMSAGFSRSTRADHNGP